MSTRKSAVQTRINPASPRSGLAVFLPGVVVAWRVRWWDACLNKRRYIPIKLVFLVARQQSIGGIVEIFRTKKESRTNSGLLGRELVNSFLNGRKECALYRNSNSLCDAGCISSHNSIGTIKIVQWYRRARCWSLLSGYTRLGAVAFFLAA